MRFERPTTLPLPLHDAPRYSPNGVRLERPSTAPLIFDERVVDESETRTASFGRSLKDQRADDGQAGPSRETHVRQSSDVTPESSISSRTLEQTFADDAAALSEYFLIDKALAVGGSSIVYQVTAKGSQRIPPDRFALKVLRPELRNEQTAVRRLYREFRYMAKLIHPHILRVFAIEHRSNVLFMTMELLQGETLATALENFQVRPISVAEALSILKQCTAALEHAHEHGIVHADFKPSNVWLDNSRQARIIDFGAAHSSEAGGSAADADESLASRVATPAYSSPQILSGAAPAPTDDVFSLACVAYELLVGRPEFALMNAAERAAVRTYLRRPDSISIQTWEVIQRGMHPQIEERTASVREFLLKLEQSLSNVRAIESPTLAVAEEIAASPAKADKNEESGLDITPWKAAAAIAVLWLIGFLWINRDGDRTPPVARTNSIAQPASELASPSAPVEAVATEPSEQPDASPPLELDPLSMRTMAPPFGEYLVADSVHAMNEEATVVRQFTIVPNASALKAASQRIVKPKSNVSFDRAALNVSERAVAAVLLIGRTGSTRDPMTIKWRAVEGSAKHGTDYAGATSGTVRFANNQAVRMLYVPLKEHEGAAGHRTFEVQLYQPSSGNAIGEIASAAVTIRKDE